MRATLCGTASSVTVTWLSSTARGDRIARVAVDAALLTFGGRQACRRRARNAERQASVRGRKVAPGKHVKRVRERYNDRQPQHHQVEG